MKTISIKELHERTGHWLRSVDEEEELIITERGRPIARMLPPVAAPKENPLLRRKWVPGAAKLVNRPLPGPSSTEIIRDARDGR